MDELWPYVEAQPDFQMTRSNLRTLLGLNVYEVLVQQQWFGEGQLVREYPCDISTSPFCKRRTRCIKNGASFERWAVCERWPTIECPSINVTNDQTRLLKFNPHGLAQTLYSLLSLQGDISRFGYGDLNIFRLGRKGIFPSDQDFYLVLQPSLSSFQLFLRELPINHADTWVFVPSWTRIPQDMRLQFSARKTVTLWALSDLLHVEQNCLQLSCLLRKSNQQLHPLDGFSGKSVPSQPVCLLHCHDGCWPLNQEEYTLLCDHFAHFHLMIDMATPLPTGRYNAWVSRYSLPENLELSRSEAQALSHLMISQKPLLPRQIRGLQQHQQAAKLVERARSKVDLPFARSDWRAFQTINESGSLQFCFRPKPNLRWALLLPPTATETPPFTDQRVLNCLFSNLTLNASP